jgi:hypothetical protein
VAQTCFAAGHGLPSPVVLDLGVQVLTLLLHFRTFFVPVNQIRTEEIEFVIQSDELTHQFVLHLAVHRFIVLSYPCWGFCFDRIPSRVASLIGRRRPMLM